ncbi:carbamoyltransferase family protein [Photorhabdus laumondii]|uniref:Carbamoyltransferase n=1 Tax=Photorhabdus laumondii subsp. clarkei TaxID=2029685 RepID=A0A329VG64_9GAMM|nr:carbamoyltransferase N-terminal domain-containing protein [Photorhabdus laumondii]RAW88992.1 carbamoyltransferase [Photorhabdus laumondii subsp. clarkei]
MNIIGISANFHDSSCALISDGQLIAAVSEERFSRFKNDSRLPIRAFRYCLEEGGINITDIDCIAYYENPYKKLSRQLASNFNFSATNGLHWLDCHKPFRDITEVLGYEKEIKFYDHHMAHAAGSYLFSGFTDAAILTSDGVGEWETSTFGYAQGDNINLFEKIEYPNSVGLFYSTITNYLGFRVLSGEYKVMGLAPYGKPIYTNKLREMFSMEKIFRFKLNMKFFDFCQINRMYTDAFIDLIGFPPREQESVMLQHHMDLAKSLQVVLEEILIKQVHDLREKVDSTNLCLSGGVALNCVATHAIRKTGLFNNIFIPPAAGDSGSALGAAALAHIEMTGKRHSYEPFTNPYLGPKFSNDNILEMLTSMEIEALDFREDREGFEQTIVEMLINGKVIGWFQGRMEFGPRALGARSIIADPRDPSMRDRLNALVKKREGFRPFAPALLEEEAANHIELSIPTPFMLETCQITSNLSLPAVTHVDGSCRPQTVTADTNPKFHSLLKAFYNATNCPILVNTSFNVRGEPIVCTPLDAVRCFGNSGIDVLVLEDFIIERTMLSEAFSKMAEIEFSFIQPPQDLFTGQFIEAIYTFI